MGRYRRPQKSAPQHSIFTKRIVGTALVSKLSFGDERIVISPDFRSILTNSSGMTFVLRTRTTVLASLLITGDAYGTKSPDSSLYISRMRPSTVTAFKEESFAPTVT